MPFMPKFKINSQFSAGATCVLYEGDCIDLLEQVPDGYFQLIVTSPPYNLGKPYEQRVAIDEYVQQQRLVIEQCYRVLNHKGSICWQVGNYVQNGQVIPLDIALYPVFASLNMKLRNRIVWRFGHGLHASKRFSGRYEVVLWFTKSDDYEFNLDAVRVPQKYPKKKYFKGPKRGQLSGNPLGKNPSDVWNIQDVWNIPNVKANHVEKTEHPCQFPVELVERLVLSMSSPHDAVLDPFIGAGTTAIAALMHNRKVVGAEIESEYVKIAKERIRLAKQGKLRVRPRERNVYDPNRPGQNLPPKHVQLDLVEKELPLLDRPQ
jgi:adenine-specific DNA-methyltransferase